MKNENMVALLISISLFKKVEQAGAFEKIAAARTTNEKVNVIRETEKFAFQVADEFVKSDEEIGEAGIKAKNELIEKLIEHNYEYFGLPSPFKNGTTLEDIRNRNGLGKAEANEPDEFFL